MLINIGVGIIAIQMIPDKIIGCGDKEGKVVCIVRYAQIEEGEGWVKGDVPFWRLSLADNLDCYFLPRPSICCQLYFCISAHSHCAAKNVSSFV